MILQRKIMKIITKTGQIFQIILIKCFIIEGFRSSKINALLNLIKEQDYDDLIYNTYVYARDLNEPKYQFLIKKREKSRNVFKLFKFFLKNIQTLWVMFTITLMIIIQKQKEKS